MSDEVINSPKGATGRPSFEFEPDQLEPFRGTGYEMIPLHAPDAKNRDGRPLGKAPFSGWRKDAPLDIDEARQLLAEGRNVGVRLRATDLVIDVDPRNFKEGDDPVKRLQENLKIKLDDWPHVVTGSLGSHYYMTMPEGFLVLDSVDEYRGIEFKAHGRQVVAPGSSHPETRKPYRWDALTEPVSSTVPAPERLLKLIERPLRPSSAEAGEYSPEQVERLLSGLKPSDYRDQTKWLELMMACHHASGGEAREEFIAWSTSDPHYAAHEWIVGRRWDSLHADSSGSRVTVNTLFKTLNDADRGDLVDEAKRADPLDDFPDDLGDLPEFIGEQQARETVLDRVNADRFTVLTGGKYLVGRESRDPRTGSFSVEWYSPDAMKQHMNAKSVETPEGKRVPLGTWWTGHPQRRQYDGVIFDPTPGATHRGYYNLWRGWAVEPVKGDWSKMQQLIREVLCRGDQASYDYVVRWMAHMVQHPGRPAEVALVFKGRKGSGKGTLCRALVELAGKHGRHVSNAGQFTGRFNEHLADTILLFVDEGFWAGDKSAEGSLKGLITEKTMTFEGKGKPIVQGPNQLHVVMASNEDWVVPATADERRFAVFEADEVAARAFPHFAALIEEDGQSGEERRQILSAMLHDLLTMDLGGWHPRKNIPQTEALAAQKVEGFRSDPLQFWWYRCLEDGRIGYFGEPDDWTEPLDADTSVKEAIVDAVNAQAKAMGRKAEFTKAKIAQFLGRVGVDVKGRDRKANRVWAVPPLEVARKDFEAWVGAPLEWPD